MSFRRLGPPMLLLAVAGLAISACHVDLKVRRLPPEKPFTVRVSSGPDDAQEVQLDPAMLVEGTRIFDERCAPCHGDTGHGDGALAEVLSIKPRDYHADEFKWGTRPEDLVRTIAGGRSQVMPPFAGELTPREIWSVAYVVWSWIPEERRGPHPTDDLESGDPGFHPASHLENP